jgi:hypothetical protein
MPGDATEDPGTHEEHAGTTQAGQGGSRGDDAGDGVGLDSQGGDGDEQLPDIKPPEVKREMTLSHLLQLVLDMWKAKIIEDDEDGTGNSPQRFTAFFFRVLERKYGLPMIVNTVAYNLIQAVEQYVTVVYI